ncbi:MAG: 30S ribosomal protein S12 methylthiotransferase RimO [Desulfobacca sp.]|uniref:30S ribosomal protein S12 methylthiotransferase RimO n=1 Tax=Desulfobacca sp. TaxID=2067990 RepID=UPI00404939BC
MPAETNNPASIGSVYPVSLGCAKNRVDTEMMLAQLEAAGWQITAAPEAADLLLVNTCGFLASASQEAIDAILELAAVKEARPGVRLVVAGCLVQRYQQDLLKLLPEVDLFVGVNDFPELTALLVAGPEAGGSRLACRRPWLDYATVSPRRLTTPFYSAYLKIAEGCSHRCTYCTIPAIRGPYRSRPLATIVAEARELASRGVIELNLVAQDTTAYGLDLAGRALLPELLEALADLGGLRWLRVLYGHPRGVSPELLQVMAAQPKICPYFDLPLQHLNDRLLRRMGRNYTQAQVRALVAEIRRVLPAAALRTSLIVGFPGENPEDVEELCEVLTELALDHVGVFAFQPEEGTPAARLREQVAAGEANRRARRVRTLQAKISRQKLRALKGRVTEVLVEGYCEESDLLLQGRLASQAPEVDGRVLITAGRGEVGTLQPVKITHTHTYDLVGELIVPTAP